MQKYERASKLDGRVVCWVSNSCSEVVLYSAALTERGSPFVFPMQSAN